MKQITEPIYSEGAMDSLRILNQALKEFHGHTPFANGFDWENQYLWAILTDEDCLMFCLKYPEYTNRFKKV